MGEGRRGGAGIDSCAMVAGSEMIAAMAAVDRGNAQDKSEVRLTVLFVCMGNCVRSQMAEALARHQVADVIVAQSAGLRPLGFIDPTARAVVEERGASMEGQFSKGLHDHSLHPSDVIVNMSGVPVTSVHFFHGRVFEDWPIGDPFGEDIVTHRNICDDIEARIKQLAARLRAESAKAS